MPLTDQLTGMKLTSISNSLIHILKTTVRMGSKSVSALAIARILRKLQRLLLDGGVIDICEICVLWQDNMRLSMIRSEPDGNRIDCSRHIDSQSLSSPGLYESLIQSVPSHHPRRYIICLRRHLDNQPVPAASSPIDQTVYL